MTMRVSGTAVVLLLCALGCGGDRDASCRRAGLVYDPALARCTCPTGTTFQDAGCAAPEDSGPTVEDACTARTWFVDDDGDGYGTDGLTIDSCARPAGYALQGGDCDDTNESIHPGQTEICDLVDDDCDVAVHGCPNGCLADSFGENLYLFCQNPMGWEQAAAECESVSYRLVAIESAGENEWLVSTAIERGLTPSVFTGGWGQWTTDDADWRWPDGTLFWQGTIASSNSRPVGSAYANWTLGAEPSQDGPMLLSTESTSTRGHWINRPRTHPFICERSP